VADRKAKAKAMPMPSWPGFDVSQETAEEGHECNRDGHLPFPVAEVRAAKEQDHSAGEDAEPLDSGEEEDDVERGLGIYEIETEHSWPKDVCPVVEHRYNESDDEWCC
jgi:hypothetical protein